VVAVRRHAAKACSSGGVDVRASTIGEGDTTKEHQQVGLPASSIVRASRSPAREADSSARVCTGHGSRACGRIEGETADPAGKATTATDPAGKKRSSKRDGRSSRKGRSNVDPAGKAATATDPAKAMKGVGGGAGPAGQGPAPDLARGVDDTGDGRSSKGDALLGISAVSLGGGQRDEEGQHVRGCRRRTQRRGGGTCEGRNEEEDADQGRQPWGTGNEQRDCSHPVPSQRAGNGAQEPSAMDPKLGWRPRRGS
jgi:hypothetical protein